MTGIRIAGAVVALAMVLGALFLQSAAAYNGPDNNGNAGNEVSNGESPEPSGH